VNYPEKVLGEYYKRSYFGVDGLWFMKTEEKHGFEEALSIDAEVWSVLAKLQARKARELLKIKGNTVKDLITALKLKWSAEEYDYEVKEESEACGVVLLKSCPWLTVMRKAGREHLTPRIGECVCTREYAAWAKEFSPGIEVRLDEMLCREKLPCRLRFNKSKT
jgi:hypothetical protein